MRCGDVRTIGTALCTLLSSLTALFLSSLSFSSLSFLGKSFCSYTRANFQVATNFLPGYSVFGNSTLVPGVQDLYFGPGLLVNGEGMFANSSTQRGFCSYSFSGLCGLAGMSFGATQYR